MLILPCVLVQIWTSAVWGVGGPRTVGRGGRTASTPRAPTAVSGAVPPVSVDLHTPTHARVSHPGASLTASSINCVSLFSM